MSANTSQGQCEYNGLMIISHLGDISTYMQKGFNGVYC